LTGFKTYREFVTETTPMERKLIAESIRAWHEDQEPTGGGGGQMGGGGMGGGMGL
jgi:hypothetical protein